MLLLTGGMLTPGGPMLLLGGGRGDMLLLAGGPLVLGYLLLNTELLGVPGLGTAPGGPVLRGGGGPAPPP